MPNRTINCRNDGCKQQADGGKGYCRRHYSAWKRGSLPKARFKTCRVEGCHKRTTARGRCEEHAARDYPGKRAAQLAEAAPAAPAAPES
jgi:hypothetical protein